ncbi:MAG: YjgP/YjgQ family permease [Candidatus Omnitrophica bacterium]|nr:YjgP/YjgQ family permease [Candidatus Omnitrophota bacterium]
MRLVDKYIFRLFLLPLLYCLFAFISIYVIVDLFGHLDEIIKSHMGIGLLLIYYLAYTPSIIVQTIPIAVLISTMYTLGNLARHNEIIALRASGISLWYILKPFLITGLFLSFLIFIVNNKVVPITTQRFLKIKEEKIENKKIAQVSSRVIKNVALYGEGNKIIYARLYNPKAKILKDVVIHKHDKKQNITSKTTAREARWTKQGWRAFNITSYKLDRHGKIKEEPTLKRRGLLDIKEKPLDFKNQRYRIEVLTLVELKNYIRRLSGASGLILQSLRVEAHNRIAYPFANLIAVLIGAAVCLRAKGGGKLLGIGLGVLVGLLFYGVFAISIALGKNGVLFPFISAWFANITFGLWGFYLINKS